MKKSNKVLIIVGASVSLLIIIGVVIYFTIFYKRDTVVNISDIDTLNYFQVAGDSHWNSVAYGRGKFVAVAGSGDNRVMTSSDGVNWTSYAVDGDSYWNSVVYGEGKFVAVASTGDYRFMTIEL